jgi:hypothetical protein
MEQRGKRILTGWALLRRIPEKFAAGKWEPAGGAKHKADT